MADNEFADWATETTLNEIKRMLEKQLNGKGTDEINKHLKKLEDNSDKLLKSDKKVNFTKELKSLNIKEGGGGGPISGSSSGGGGGPVAAVISEGFKKVTTASHGVAGGGGGPTGKKAKEATKSIASAAKKGASGLFNFASILSKSIIGVVAFTATMGALGKYVGESIDSYRTLTDTGNTFGGSILEMRKQSAEMAMGFQDFVGVMSKNSEIIKSVGTVAFIQLQRETRKINGQFGNFGLTLTESSEFLADYLEQSIRFGNHEKMDQQQQSVGFQKYMMELTMMSEVTGRSRKELAKSIKGTATQFDLRVAQLGMTDSQRTAFRKGIDSVKVGLEGMGPDMANMMKEAIGQQITMGNIGTSTMGKVMSYMDSQSRVAMESMMEKISAGGEGAKEALGEFNERLRSPEFRASMQMAIRGNEEGAIQLFKAMEPLDKMSKKQFSDYIKNTKMSDDERKAIMTKRSEENKGTNALLDMQSKVGVAFGLIQKVILNALTPAITWIGEKFSELADFIGDFMKLFSGDLSKTSESFKAMYKAISPLMKSFKSFMTTILKPVGEMFKFVYEKLKLMVEKINWESIVGGLIKLTEALSYVGKFVFGIFSSLITGLYDALPVDLFADTFDKVGSALSSIGDFFISWYKLLDEIGIIDLLGWVFKQIGWVFGKIINVLVWVAGIFTSVFGGIFDILGGFIDGIRKIVFMIKNPLKYAMMSSDAIDKELGINQKKEAKVATAVQKDVAKEGSRSVQGVNPERVRLGGNAKQDSSTSGFARLERRLDDAQTNLLEARGIGSEKEIKRQTEIMERMLARLERAESYQEQQVIETKKLGRSRAVGMTETN